jgi:plastocyanin
MSGIIYAAILMLIVINAGCHARPALTNSTDDAVTVTARDHAFEGPASMNAGHVTMRLVNQGRAPHHAQLVRLTQGKTAEDFMAAIKAEPSAIPAWARYTGGPNAVMGNETAEATLDLEAGEYMLICQVPDRQGIPHLASGMVKSVRVIEDQRRRRGATSDPADSVIRTLDFRFNVQQPLRAGQQRVRFVNRGVQPHEAVLVHLNPGATLNDFVAFFGPNASGPPPGRPVGGMTGLEQDQEGSFVVKLTPGHYGLICFFLDPGSGMPHFAKGMSTEFDVE